MRPITVPSYSLRSCDACFAVREASCHALLICRVFILSTEEDVKRMLDLHVTESNEILFTTFGMHTGDREENVVPGFCHIWENLREIGRLKNAVLLTYDLHACQLMWENGIPCFLDRYLPQPEELKGTVYNPPKPHPLPPSPLPSFPTPFPHFLPHSRVFPCVMR